MDNPGVVAPPPLIFLAPLIVGLLLHWAFPITLMPAPIPLTVGLPVIAMGASLFVWAIRAMIRAGTSPDPSEPTKKIVFDGPFRFSRNPIYLSFTIIYVGVTVSTNAVWPILLLPPTVSVLRRGVIEREERYLEEKFGQEYMQYKARVRRWV